MAEQTLFTEEREIESPREKKGVIRRVTYAATFLGCLGVATALNMGGYPLATFVSGLGALVSLALFLGSLRSDR